MVPPDSDGISLVPPYSGFLYRALPVRLRDSHPLRSTFPRRSAKVTQSDIEVLQPRTGRNQPGLGSSPFARHYLGNHCYFLFLQVLRCFSSLGLPLLPYRKRSLRFTQWGCPIRTSADHLVCANPRSFSQLIASFIASESLGIPRVPLLTSLVCSTLR